MALRATDLVEHLVRAPCRSCHLEDRPREWIAALNDGRGPARKLARSESDGSILFVQDSPSPRVALAVVGDYLVLGNAVEHIKRAASGKGQGWDPVRDATGLVSGEVFMQDLLSVVPERLIGGLPYGIPEGLILDIARVGHVSFSLEQKGQGALCSVKAESAKDAGGRIAMWAGLLSPLIARSRENGQSSVCKRNLRKIGEGSMAYLDRFGQSKYYPKSPARLWSTTILRERATFVCPSDPAPEDLAQGIECSYDSAFDRYPAFTFLRNTSSHLLLPWERKNFHEEGYRNVVFFDAHCEKLSEKRFQEHLRLLDDMVRDHTKGR